MDRVKILEKRIDMLCVIIDGMKLYDPDTFKLVEEALKWVPNDAPK